MNKIVSVRLEWEYKPSDYLVKSLSVSDSEIEISLADGLAKATMDANIFESTSTFYDYLTNKIESILLGAQIYSYMDFSLSNPCRTDIDENGKEIRYFGTGHCRVTGGKVYIFDMQERINKEKWFAEKVLKYRSADITLDQILQSNKMAIKDSGNELVHLYEIRDALSKHFKNQKSARDKLGINKKDWDMLGNLANKSNIKQGRHRGKFAGLLRDATANELNSAREITYTLSNSKLRALYCAILDYPL